MLSPAWMLRHEGGNISSADDYATWDDTAARRKALDWVEDSAGNEFPRMNEVIVKCPQEYKAQQTSASAVQLQKPPHLKVAQGRSGGFAAGVATDHAAALLPAALAFDLVGGRAVLGHPPGHAHPLWPLKNSQSARPAALAITFTRRAICDSDSPNTFTSPPTPIGRMASRARMAAGVMATTAPLGLHVGLGADDGDAAAAVVPALQVAPGQRRRLGAPQPPVREDGHQGQVEAGALGGLRWRFEAAAAGTGFRSGEPDHSQHVGGEGAGLALGPGQTPGPSSQRGAHTWVPAGRFVAGPLVGLGDGAGGEAQGGNAGAIAGPHRQVTGDGEGFGRQGAEVHRVAPFSEKLSLG